MKTSESIMLSDQKYRAGSLVDFAAALLTKAGMPNDRANVVAEALVEGDLLGHTTHGLQLLPLYLTALAKHQIQAEGDPTTVADKGSAITWDGNWLPGPWLMRRAMDIAFSRISEHPVVTIVIRRAGHIGCLAVYPRIATERDLMMLVSCSDPSVAVVAPSGAVEGRISPNPIAAGWPTETEPVILDICPSTTTSGMVARASRSGERLPGPWLIDRSGKASDDPGVLAEKPPGAILPLGGLDLGHKGFALGLLVEAFTGALAGYGRANKTDHWGATVYMQIIDPSAFGGIDAFKRETSYISNSCRAAAAVPGQPPVRMPGERALHLRAQQFDQGIRLHRGILPLIEDWAENFHVPMPVAFAASSE
jgi:LDH2 family malate/lactate/ureidoglycolate dehydrogenase